MSIEVLNPTYGHAAEQLARADRRVDLTGLTVGIISNGKQNTAPFFDEVERVLRDDIGVGEVVRIIKTDYSAPADADAIDAARSWHGLIAGIGD